MKYVLIVLALLTAGSAFAQEPGRKLYINEEAPGVTVDSNNKVVTQAAGAFQLVLQAALMKEKVNLVLVTNPRDADYIMNWDMGPGFRSVYNLTASITTKDGRVIWVSTEHGNTLQWCSQSVARHLRSAMKHKT